MLREWPPELLMLPEGRSVPSEERMETSWSSSSASVHSSSVVREAERSEVREDNVEDANRIDPCSDVNASPSQV